MSQMPPEPPSLDGRRSSLDTEQARYQVEGLLASGGMGALFRATDHDLGRTVALKTVQTSWRDPESMRRFVEEARANGRLEHPHILPIYEVGLDAQGVPYYTMPVLEGETLTAIIERLRRKDLETHTLYPLSRRLTMIGQLCDALHFAHSRGVIHRDVKPDNVMVGSEGEVFLLDWGLATSGPSSEDLAGTPGYLAPELCGEGQPSVRSDLYGLGALMYEFLTLSPAHPGSDVGQRLQHNIAKRPKPAFQVFPPGQARVPKEISNIVMQLLRPEPARRQESAREVRDSIMAALDGEAPVSCLCTGAKRATFGLGHLVDQFGGVAVLFLACWLLSPLLVMLLLARGVLVLQ